ncbi:MAG TPA: flagellin [Candidatus Anaerobiospirillum stercoravium]|nr:flagellin [Candidatus Anaerobiospirillum stercoravium]
MALYLTNIASMRSQYYLGLATSDLNTSMQRLASGYRINSAKDDPAGLMISNRMTSEINGLGQANRNAADGSALAATYEGALDETVNMLQRIRTLAVQAANGTYGQSERDAIAQEMNSLADEITRIAEDTTFAGETILLGEDSTMFDKGMLTLQVGPNTGNTITTDFSQSMKLKDIADAAGVANTVVDANGHFVLNSQDDANNLIGAIDDMIGVVDGQRGQAGALQVRLESTMRLNSTMQANVADARSRIRDTDYAAEVSNMISAQIRQQVSLQMLMMSNQQGNLILQLLGGV